MYFWSWYKIWDCWANKHIAEVVEGLVLLSLEDTGEIRGRKKRMDTEKLRIEMTHSRVVKETFYIWMINWRMDDQFLVSWGDIVHVPLLLYLHKIIFDPK